MTTAASKFSVGPAEHFRAALEYEITPAGLRALLDRTPGIVCVVDVRERAAYDAGHIPGARHVPIERLVSSFSALPKDKLIVVYSEDMACALSTRAAMELAQKKFRVQRLIGGLELWTRKGHPVEETPGDAPSQAW